MDFLLLYGQPVTVTQGFYRGQEGTIEAMCPLEESHVDEERPVIAYRIRLANGAITEHVHEYYIEVKKQPRGKKAKVINITDKT